MTGGQTRSADATGGDSGQSVGGGERRRGKEQAKYTAKGASNAAQSSLLARRRTMVLKNCLPLGYLQRGEGRGERGGRGSDGGPISG